MAAALIQFAAWSLVLLLVVMVLTVMAVSAVARGDLVRDAARVARGVGHGIIEPLLTDAFLAGDPAAVRTVDTQVRNRMRDGSIARIKIWTADGQVLWSDAEHLVGRQFTLRKEVADLTRTQGVRAEISDLDDAENELEQSRGTMVEAYAGLRSTNGQPLLFEVYIPTDSLSRDTRALIWSLAPVALGGLLLFQLGILPLSVSLARRVDRAGQEKAHLLRNAVAATDLERSRVAQDLHDGVIQDLAGLSFLLSSAPTGADADRAQLQEIVHIAEGIVQRDARALRSLLTDLYPPNLDGDGLAQGLEDLARQAGAAGVEVDLEIGHQDQIPTSVARLAYRVVREGLRNVVRHSGATRAQVRLDSRSRCVTVAVSDDGRGIDDVLLPADGSGVPVAEGHLGLRLLRDTVSHVGGTFGLTSVPGQGTTLEVTIPDFAVSEPTTPSSLTRSGLLRRFRRAARTP